jgi:hypothetical protein
MELTQRILDYWDKYLSEGSYLDELAGSVAVDDLFTATVELLRSSDYETLSTTLGFVQDLIIYSPGDERQAVKAAYPESIVVKAIETLLLSENHFLRQQTGYTLGKTCSYSSLPAMIEAFAWWRDRDPLMLPFFVGELGWLGAENFHDLVGQMISSPGFTTRWAAIDCLARSGGAKRQQQSRFDLLRNDHNYLVRQEAEHAYRVHLFRMRGSTEFYPEPPFEFTPQREAIDQKYQPAVVFSNIKVRFTKYLHELGQTDYTIDQLETFIENYVVVSRVNP